MEKKTEPKLVSNETKTAPAYPAVNAAIYSQREPDLFEDYVQDARWRE